MKYIICWSLILLFLAQECVVDGFFLDLALSALAGPMGSITSNKTPKGPLGEFTVDEVNTKDCGYSAESVKALLKSQGVDINELGRKYLSGANRGKKMQITIKIKPSTPKPEPPPYMQRDPPCFTSTTTTTTTTSPEPEDSCSCNNRRNKHRDKPNSFESSEKYFKSPKNDGKVKNSKKKNCKENNSEPLIPKLTPDHLSNTDNQGTISGNTASSLPPTHNHLTNGLHQSFSKDQFPRPNSGFSQPNVLVVPNANHICNCALCPISHPEVQNMIAGAPSVIGLNHICNCPVCPLTQNKNEKVSPPSQGNSIAYPRGVGHPNAIPAQMNPVGQFPPHFMSTPQGNSIPFPHGMGYPNAIPPQMHPAGQYPPNFMSTPQGNSIPFPQGMGYPNAIPPQMYPAGQYPPDFMSTPQGNSIGYPYAVGSPNAIPPHMNSAGQPQGTPMAKPPAFGQPNAIPPLQPNKTLI